MTAMPDALLNGGNATIYVSDMDAAVAFYTGTLGLALGSRAGEDWATVDAGGGLSLGLHRASHPGAPAPGSRGAISVGFAVGRPIAEVMATLAERGVTFRGPVAERGFVKLAFFTDPDGNALYLAETPARS